MQHTLHTVLHNVLFSCSFYSTAATMCVSCTGNRTYWTLSWWSIDSVKWIKHGVPFTYKPKREIVSSYVGNRSSEKKQLDRLASPNVNSFFLVLFCLLSVNRQSHGGTMNSYAKNSRKNQQKLTWECIVLMIGDEFFLIALYSSVGLVLMQ